MEMTLRMPSTYVDIDRDEMEYIDGGWSGYVAARNAWGYIQQKGMSRALAYAGISCSDIMAWASYSYTFACSIIGYQTTKIATCVGGVIGGVLAFAGTAYLIHWLGSERRYY